MPYITSVERIARQEGRQEGWQEGRQGGRQEGRQEGEAAVLLRLITLKFSPPSKPVLQRVQEADAGIFASASQAEPLCGPLLTTEGNDRR